MEIKVSLMDQVFMVSATLMLKYSFTSQKPPSFTWEKMADPAPVAMVSNSGRTPGLCARMGARMPAAVVKATVADPVARRITAATSHPNEQQRYMGVQRHRDNRLRDAAILKDAPKPAARSDHQRDVSRRRQAFIGKLKNRLPVEAAHFAQGEKADQHRYQ